MSAKRNIAGVITVTVHNLRLLPTGGEDAMKSGNLNNSKDLVKAYEAMRKAIVARKLARRNVRRVSSEIFEWVHYGA